MLLAIYRSIKLFFVFLFVVIFIYGIFPFLGQTKQKKWIKKLSQFLLNAVGIQVKLKGHWQQYQNMTNSYMVCANHISFFDIFALNAFMPVSFVAKKEIRSWPIFGRIAAITHTIFIDRANRRALLQIIEQMGQSLRQGHSVTFFPEGTTGPGDRLLPFHSNLFVVAVNEKVPVIPVALRYTCDNALTVCTSYADRSMKRILLDVLKTKNLAVEIDVGESIPYQERQSRQRICSKVSSQIAQQLGWDNPDAKKN